MASLCHPWFTTTNLSYRFSYFWNFRHRLVQYYWYYIVSSPRKPRFVLVPIRFASEACLGQASPSLEASRLHALEARGLFHQKKQKGKDCHDQDKQVQGASFGFVFGTWNWYDFWRRSCGLPCSGGQVPYKAPRLQWWTLKTQPKHGGLPHLDDHAAGQLAGAVPRDYLHSHVFFPSIASRLSPGRINTPVHEMN